MTQPPKGPWKVLKEYPQWMVNPNGDIRKRANITSDGRNVKGDEWRKIKEFPTYEMNSVGDVRNHKSHRILLEGQNQFGVWHYNFSRKDRYGNWKTFKRSTQKLIYTTFPELKPPAKVITAARRNKYSTRGGWRDIPDFDWKYQIHPDGIVRYKNSRRRLKIIGEGQDAYVMLHPGRGSRGHETYIRDLLVHCIDTEENQAA